MHILKNGFNGSTIKHISKDYIKNIKIPVPSLKVQQKIVERLNLLSENNKTMKKIIEQLKQNIKYYIECNTMTCQNKKKLCDICNFLPTTKHISSIGKKNGKYRFYNSSQKDKLYLDKYEVETDSIIIGNGGNICVHFDELFTPSKHVTVCQVKDKSKTNSKYIYYYVLNNVDKLINMSAGSTIKWLNKTNIGKFKIPILSIKEQNEIVNYCDNIQNIINSIKKQIESNKKLMKDIINKFISSNTII